VRGLANLLIALGIGLWTAGMAMGPGGKLVWTLGSYAPLSLVLGLFIHLVLLIVPSDSAPRVAARKAELRKCATCGRPAVAGSDYCRYHTDEQHYLGGGGR